MSVLSSVQSRLKRSGKVVVGKGIRHFENLVLALDDCLFSLSPIF